RGNPIVGSGRIERNVAVRVRQARHAAGWVVVINGCGTQWSEEKYRQRYADETHQPKHLFSHGLISPETSAAVSRFCRMTANSGSSGAGYWKSDIFQPNTPFLAGFAGPLPSCRIRK